VSVSQSSGIPSYRASQFACVGFRQHINSLIRTENGIQSFRETSGRDGVLRVRGTDSSGVLSLQSWFDSLTVWREGPDGKLQPETDGVVGGRYYGTLDPSGSYTRLDAPFVPPELAQVNDVAAALDDMFPLLPPTGLRVGQVWSDSAGVTLERLPDGTVEGRSVERFRLRAQREGTAPVRVGDSTLVDAVRSEQETSTIVWDPNGGLLTWDRDIVVDATVAAGGVVPRGVRSRVEQKIRLDRVALPPGGCS
jgi:hypothetical protein